MNITFPDGEEVIMSEEIFNQAPSMFIAYVVGTMAVGRLINREGDRLNSIYNRPFIIDILSKDCPTWADYQSIIDACL